MTDSVYSREELLADYRSRSKTYQFLSISNTQQVEYEEQGWEVVRENVKTVRMKRLKIHSKHLEDRVWTLMYRMGFIKLSDREGLILPNPAGSPGKSGTNQIDVVAVDDEVAIAIECKSQEKLSKRPQLQLEVGKLKNTQSRFTSFARSLDNVAVKRLIGLVIVVSNVELTQADYDRSTEQQITLLDDSDLEYYEELTKHLGVAARYQFLADVLANRKVPELNITVPAIRTKMGKETAYSFSISPEYLLKIAYVSHRAKGKASDVNAYQRMVKKSRLTAIRKYIEEEANVFPTNIVVSLDDNARFDQRQNEGTTKDDLGWLHLAPKYRSAWIIDGQHRLLAYAGTSRAKTSRLSVLAFQQLSASKQAQLFVDINAKQKAVRTDLLHELFSELHWNSDKIEDRIQAVTTKLLRSMDADPDSPLHIRVVKAEGSKDPARCLTVTELAKPLAHSEFFMGSARKGTVSKPGIFWSEDNEIMLARSKKILNAWFSEIRDRTIGWWDLGSASGGGLAMNDGIVSLLMVLRSVVSHLRSNGKDLYESDDMAAIGALKPYGEAVGKYLATFDFEARQRFRRGRGTQGTTHRMRRIQQALILEFPDFDPPGLAKFLEEEAAETNGQSKEIIDRMEKLIQKEVVRELKDRYQESVDAWWFQGVPKAIRGPVSGRMEDDDNSRNGKENYFNLIDYRKIVLNHWPEFEETFGLEPKGNKDKRTSWMNTLNELRNAVSHASSGKSVSFEELEELKTIEETFLQKLSGDEPEVTTSSA